MDNEKRAVNSLSDEELAQVSGGTRHHDTETDKYYIFTGRDCNNMYLCPKCGGPLKSDWGFRFDCDPCDDWWVFQRNLKINPSYWKEISKEEYYSYGNQGF